MSESELRYICDREEGFKRIRKGKGFLYLDPSGKKIEDERILKRIKSLVIPPMWKEVWICPDENGYLQCTGKDQKNRKQYLYHSKWVKAQQEHKYERLPVFGKRLNDIRKRIKRDLDKPGWHKEKILALTITLLDKYYFRVGNTRYTKENQSYGLTTLRRKHLDISGKHPRLMYKAKSGKYREVNITDRKLSRLIREISELPGYEIFKFYDENQTGHHLSSSDINHYLHKISNENLNAKDFRTWGGTKLLLEILPEVWKAAKENPKKKLETQLVKTVANRLNNTVSVCRKYYIHPDVLNYALNTSPAEYQKDLQACCKWKSFPELENTEKLVLKILK